MRYVSVFSGIGGLEHPHAPPVAFCDTSTTSRIVLSRLYPDANAIADVNDLVTKIGGLGTIDAIVGGWPCQDVSSAGKQVGLAGDRSGLVFAMLEAAVRAGAGTLVAENVPHLLHVNGGSDFRHLVCTLQRAGYPYVSWRVLNTNHFGLPQYRRRLFLIASRERNVASSLLRSIASRRRYSPEPSTGGFYWTAGTQSLCYRIGLVPAIKIGSSIAVPSAPAVLIDGRIHVVTAREALRLQGFDRMAPFKGIRESELLAAAGNAVSARVGSWVVGGVAMALGKEGCVPGNALDFDGRLHLQSAATTQSVAGAHTAGFVEPRFAWLAQRDASREIKYTGNSLRSLITLTESRAEISQRAARGLLTRVTRADRQLPSDLEFALERASGTDRLSVRRLHDTVDELRVSADRARHSDTEADAPQLFAA